MMLRRETRVVEAGLVGSGNERAIGGGVRYALAGLVVLQLLAYLLFWVQMHALPAEHKPDVASQKLISTGWYEPGTSYTRLVRHVPGLSSSIQSNFLRHRLLGVSFVLAGAGYVGALVLVQKRPVRLHVVVLLLLTTLIALPLLLLPQMLSGDLWGYVLYGRVAVLHGGNPIVDVAALWPADPFLPRMYWKTTPSVYGPGWVMVGIALTWIAERMGGAPWTYALVFKGFIFAAHLANTLLIRRILQKIRPGHETMGAILYAWSPLCMIEFAGSAHNDCFMLTLLLLGILAAVHGRSTTAAGWIAAAGLTKLPGLIGLPLYLLRTLSRREHGWAMKLATQVAAAAVLAVVLYTPFWRGRSTFQGTAHAPNLHMVWHSWAAIVDQKLESHFAHGHPKHYRIPPPGSMYDHVRTAVRTGSMFCFVACLIPLTLKPVGSDEQWLQRLVCIYLAYLLFAAFQFSPWYGTWLVVLAALVPRSAPLLIGVTLLLLIYYLPGESVRKDLCYLVPLAIAWAVEMTCVAETMGNDRTDIATIGTPL